MMSPRIIEYRSPEYIKMLALRYEVLRKPLGLTFAEEDFDNDKHDILLALSLTDIDEIEACCILTAVDEQTVKLRQMAVRPNRQRMGLGENMLLFAEDIAQKEGFNQIILHARKVAVDFYLKCNYRIVGDEFIEVGISHVKMEKQINNERR